MTQDQMGAISLEVGEMMTGSRVPRSQEQRQSMEAEQRGSVLGQQGPPSHGQAEEGSDKGVLLLPSSCFTLACVPTVLTSAKVLEAALSSSVIPIDWVGRGCNRESTRTSTHG